MQAVVHYGVEETDWGTGDYKPEYRYEYYIWNYCLMIYREQHKYMLSDYFYMDLFGDTRQVLRQVMKKCTLIYKSHL